MVSGVSDFDVFILEVPPQFSQVRPILHPDAQGFIDSDLVLRISGFIRGDDSPCNARLFFFEVYERFELVFIVFDLDLGLEYIGVTGGNFRLGCEDLDRSQCPHFHLSLVFCQQVLS